MSAELRLVGTRWSTDVNWDLLEQSDGCERGFARTVSLRPYCRRWRGVTRAAERGSGPAKTEDWISLRALCAQRDREPSAAFSCGSRPRTVLRGVISVIVDRIYSISMYHDRAS